MRLKTYIETQELTEGTFLFEQQVYRELQECTYEDWCNILDDIVLTEDKEPWWVAKGLKYQQQYVKDNPKSDTARDIKKYLATKDTSKDSGDAPETSGKDNPEKPNPERYNQPLSKYPTLKKALQGGVKDLVKDTAVEYEKLKDAIKEKSVFRVVKSMGLVAGKPLLDAYGVIDRAVDFGSDKLAATKAVQGLQKGLIKVDSFLDQYPKLKTVSGVAIAGFLTYQWINMSFTGNLDSDYDLSTIPDALAGRIGFTEILATPQGVKGMALLAAGLATGGMTTLWRGGKIGFMYAAAYTGAKKIGDKATENKLFAKMRQLVKGDAGELDDKDREPDDPEVKT